MTTNISKQNWT